MITAKMTYGERFTHPERCETCGGRVATCPDPDSKPNKPIPDMTYCTGCASIFSEWTMNHYYASKEKTA